MYMGEKNIFYFSDVDPDQHKSALIHIMGDLLYPDPDPGGKLRRILAKKSDENLNKKIKQTQNQYFCPCKLFTNIFW